AVVGADGASLRSDQEALVAAGTEPERAAQRAYGRDQGVPCHWCLREVRERRSVHAGRSAPGWPGLCSDQSAWSAATAAAGIRPVRGPVQTVQELLLTSPDRCATLSTRRRPAGPPEARTHVLPQR